MQLMLSSILLGSAIALYMGDFAFEPFKQDEKLGRPDLIVVNKGVECWYWFDYSRMLYPAQPTTIAKKCK